MLHSTPRLASAHPAIICTDCLGAGQHAPDGANLMVCWRCDGKGHYRCDAPQERSAPPNREPKRRYAATSGAEVIDEGLRLDDFIREMSDGWENGDLAVWLDEEGQGPRLVVVIRPQAKGVPTVLYL